MRKGSLLATVVVVTLVVAALFGLAGPDGAVGAQNDVRKKDLAATLEIEGLTPASEPIDVLAWSWGASNSGTVGGGGGGGAGRVNIQDLSFTKLMDTRSPELVQALVTGEHFASATLLVNATGKAGPPTHRYELDEVLLTSVSQGGCGGSQTTENVTINFGTFEFTHA
jgi:type VI secretion system secreted protein Hcp